VSDALGDEDGIVPKPPTPSRRGRDPAFASPLEDLRGTVGDRYGHRRAVPRRAPLRGDIREQVQDAGVTLGVGRRGAEESRRVDAGRAAERIDFDPGVVGERGQAGRGRGGDGLRRRVFRVGGSDLRRGADAREVVKRDPRDAQVRVDRRDLAGLPGVPSRQDDPGRGRAWVTAPRRYQTGPLVVWRSG
jgi:hypothetical protein